MASALDKALAAQYAGNGPMFMPSTPVNNLYAGIYPTAAPRTNPLAPSQGGSWPASQPQRPRATALSPQNYTPSAPPHIPNDPRRATADMRQPGLPAYPGTMQPFPLAYPDNAPIDITVRGGNVASIPLPQARPWNAPNEMDLAAIAALESSVMPSPTASAYAPQVAPPPGVATPAGQAPQTSWMQDMMTGINGLLAGNAPKPMNPGQRYAATNAAAANRKSTATGVSTAGYTYVNGKNMGYSEAERAARAIKGKEIGDANRKNPNKTYDITGRDNSFSPRSVQNSVRWQTGY